ncbi:aminotransferase class I/II-fold pyridoxal phosphate-dependent enzyme [Hoeflea ulvae]|uniref:Aminotransferase class I/II-fold pyridoxal phosphate-dependent enzyme n=1 Tax=Hoeflea ulvae TaxID=2983764 RepID=A0ABT3YKV2_9HYPH|nr:aminotransferase class I/II-fold pyridoxal phosphate-dependent enzyme [Hoeflea ulvae]MCY0096375.1 aminotransferase class I/II-fold pyridoxal phosphate-dependent enzyme [Hoeflea ulvae]
MTNDTKPVPAADGGTKRAALDFMRSKTAKAQPDSRQAKPGGSGSAPLRPVPAFSDLPQYKQMKVHQAAGVALGIENPFYRAHEGAPGAMTVISGKTYSNFASYDYLSLNQDPRVRAAAVEAIAQYGVSSSASRLVAGERPVHQELEGKLAAFHGVEAAVAMVSGYLTNLTTITCLMGATDLILHDELIHNSVLAGAQACGATRRSFKHNDLDDLERSLLRLSARHRRVMVIVEGLYSMDGDLADLPRLIELRRKHGFWLMVDEAHAVGVLGATGRGSAEHFGVDPAEVDIWMGTLSKTTASCGGYIAGKAELIDCLKGYAGGFVYSVGLPPSLAAAASKALDIIVEEPQRVTRLHDRSHYFVGQLKAAGLDTGSCAGFAVIPVMVGDSIRAAMLSGAMLEAGINVLPILFPAVPEGSARLRFFINFDHTEEQLAFAAVETAKALQVIVDLGVDISSIDISDVMDFVGT